MDTLITFAIVGAAALWAFWRAFRRATAKPTTCGGTCAGCDLGRAARPVTSASPEGGYGVLPDTGTATGIRLPSRADGRR